MTVMLEKTLKRELTVGGDAYVLTISPDGFKLTPKGRRIGLELAWQDLVNGEAALAVALNASLDRVASRDRRAPSKPQVPARPADSAGTARPRPAGPAGSRSAARARGRRRAT